ncbi:hypothetical protein H6G06_11855 [Anabaena sphaerica FACHB-251]|uniref:Lipoprotein n=1 Tax=Anabaena sphaerica FACHB-251 TaxID=2692883 RepID=A0A926WGJ0_9NOST|nr:hypothetical protein [Anabaena sphaerica]MBD2294166.1 hypothetical protein [Anabaena sphaerica FACHB-251]
MKNLLTTIYLILSCISFASCSNSPTNTTTETLTNNTATTAQSQPENSPEPETETKPKTDTQAKTKSVPQTVSNTTKKSQSPQTKTPKKPQIGTVKELVNGDLLCYVTLVDEQGKENRVGASFEICAEEGKFLNKKVRAVSTIESVSDCESAEPCGKTRQESIITKMEVLEDKSATKPQESKTQSKTQTISNGEWTITTGNHDSWTGVNNTGNLTYKGCDAKGKCIELTGGRVSCRDGICVTGWTNGDYVYILEQPITEDGNAPQTLIVRKGDSEILKATGLK